MEKTVSAKQFAIIIFIVTVSSRIFMLPALILSISGRDSWLTLLVYFLLDLLALSFILYANKKNPNTNIYELLRTASGKILSKIIIAFLIVFYLFKATVMISELKVFFTITATRNLNWQLCVFPLVIALGLMSLKSLRSIGRVGEIFAPFFLISLVIVGLIIAKSTDFTNILPIFENGINDNLYSFMMLPIWLMDFSILSIFLGKIEKRKNLFKLSFISCSISFLVVLYFNIVMYTAYSNTPRLLEYGHNLTNMVLYPTGTYNYGRFDLALFSVWMVGVLVHVTLLFYASTRHMAYLTRNKNKYICGVICMALLLLLIVVIFPDEQLILAYSTDVFNFVAFVLEFLFPLLLLIFSFTYKRKARKIKCLLNEC